MNIQKSHRCDRSLLHPSLDIRYVSYTIHQVFDLGNIVETRLILKSRTEAVQLNISPGDRIANKVLTSTSNQSFLKLSQTVRKRLIEVLLHLFLII